MQTGAGTVLDVLRVPPGSSIAVFGAGSVGLCAIMAARLSRRDDDHRGHRRASRLELAREFGATHLISPTEVDPLDAIRQATGGAVWSSPSRPPAIPAVFTTAVRLLDSLGTCAYVGTAPPGVTGGVPMLEAMTKGLTGPRRPAGRQHARRDDPPPLGAAPAGRPAVRPADHPLPARQINQAAADCLGGDVVKPVILMDGTRPAA